MNKYQMKLEAKNLLKEKLLALKKMMFDMFTDEYNSKVCTRNYTTLKDIINQYKNVIDDIDSLIDKYCKEEKGVKNKMNKYQKALDYLAENSMYETVGRRGREIWKEVTHEGIEAQDLLQELVDKATPKKPRIKFDYTDFDGIQYGFGYYIYPYVCPNCSSTLYEDTEELKINDFQDNYNQDIEYCRCCGQALDWSEEND